MTSFEAGMWIAGGLFAAAAVFGGIGAYLEDKTRGAETVPYMFAVALLGMSALFAIKSLLGLVIN